MNKEQIMDTALRRIYAAAHAVLSGEEAPTQALQEIQMMAFAGLRGEDMDWPWLEKAGLPTDEPDVSPYLRQPTRTIEEVEKEKKR